MTARPINAAPTRPRSFEIWTELAAPVKADGEAEAVVTPEPEARAVVGAVPLEMGKGAAVVVMTGTTLVRVVEALVVVEVADVVLALEEEEPLATSENWFVWARMPPLVVLTRLTW